MVTISVVRLTHVSLWGVVQFTRYIYIYIDPKTHRACISRHVVFDEMTFSYKKSREDPTPSNLVFSEFSYMDEWLESLSGSP